MLLAPEFLTAAVLVAAGPISAGPTSAAAGALDAGLSAIQPHGAAPAAAPAEMGLARLRRVRLTVTGDPGRRVLLGLAPAEQSTVLAEIPGLVLGPQGLAWIADGSVDPAASIGLDGTYETELVVPDGLPLGTHMVAQAITIDPLTGAHDVSPALDLRVEDVIEFQFDGSAAGWRAVTGEAAVGPDGLTIAGPALLVRPLQGLEAGAAYRVEMTVGLGFESDAAPTLRVGAGPVSPTEPASDGVPIEWESVTSGTAAAPAGSKADHRGRLWIQLESGAGTLVLQHAMVRIRR
ncbi:hypothetical protein [Engelhardtia mirabilis]|uniref:Uncharacterized protein n=1 Tax=Engelhardtia mirabilis TaxID=2528011 RepID=A0A518BHD5_9BACT|nr:hypothetical protein Pla133_14450 [Planctomycetes bacterium Pla133]QDV00701.1 hypothetical protein Pla86_14440 [Planctomycetes bacterium Pla86]